MVSSDASVVPANDPAGPTGPRVPVGRPAAALARPAAAVALHPPRTRAPWFMIVVESDAYMVVSYHDHEK